MEAFIADRQTFKEAYAIGEIMKTLGSDREVQLLALPLTSSAVVDTTTTG